VSALLGDKVARTRRNVHKGTFGTLAIIGGAPGMVGAAILAGRAAMRAGAGKVRIGFVGSAPSFDPNAPELMLGAVAPRSTPRRRSSRAPASGPTTPRPTRCAMRSTRACRSFSTPTR
jgi:NAD(P)H-hydrate repair Nnr-like enzyme with NAD(P)H-hydrate dehydratase domain